MAERINTILRHLSSTSNAVVNNPTSAGLAVNTSETYQYTRGGGLLTQAERDFYEKNGFLVVRGLVPLEKLKDYEVRFKEVCQGKVRIPGMTVMRDIAYAKAANIPPEEAINKIQDFQMDDGFFEYCSLPDVVKYVEDIVGPNLMAIHTMLINKPPDKGTKSSRHPMHQDLHYFPIRPAERIVASWTAMEKINRENGCLVVMPGTHKGELLAHGYPDWEGGVNKMYHGVKDYNPKEGDRVFLDMEAGDTVFFHPKLIHGSGANQTNRFRKAISCHYAASDCHYIDVTGSTQEEVKDEVMQLVKKRLGEDVEVKYEDVWKYKSRLAKGERINL